MGCDMEGWMGGWGGIFVFGMNLHGVYRVSFGKRSWGEGRRGGKGMMYV